MPRCAQVGQGQNPARQAAVGAGIPFEATAYGVNQLCGSGLRTVALGYQAILAGDSEIVVAGGQESMSQAPHCIHLRNGVKMGDAAMIDTMIKDGLWDAFNGYHMGNTAENVARQWQITRQQQDEYAVAHHSGGLGIGLAVVRDLVEAHGGAVAARSPGRDLGSDFTVSLPMSTMPIAAATA